MSLESVRAWLAANAPDLRLIETHESTATVDTEFRGARQTGRSSRCRRRCSIGRNERMRSGGPQPGRPETG